MTGKEDTNLLENRLIALNNRMQDEWHIPISRRAEIAAGMILAGMSADGLSVLTPDMLTGSDNPIQNDGSIVIGHIEEILYANKLPDEVIHLIADELSMVYKDSDLWKPVNGESRIKSMYRYMVGEILPALCCSKLSDGAATLYNVMNTWSDIPDGSTNDVVLTPDYIGELMAAMCKVNRDSHVLDITAGSGSLLSSAVRVMERDAAISGMSGSQLADKMAQIEEEQILGVEKRADIYMFAVINVFVSGRKFPNLICADSLLKNDGRYRYGKMAGRIFPADVLLLNPPYSAEGKGFVFASRAMSVMRGGRAAILIQESAGSGAGLPYTAEALRNNTLLASVHMPAIFSGRAEVQTAIYLFDVGKSHDTGSIVRFIDFSNDGYARRRRRKSSSVVNLQNIDHAYERYAEVMNLVLHGKGKMEYFTEEDYVEDTISLEGNDWTFEQHRRINISPTEDEFRATVSENILHEISNMLADRGLSAGK